LPYNSKKIKYHLNSNKNNILAKLIVRNSLYYGMQQHYIKYYVY